MINTNYKNLSEEQLRAILCEDDNILVSAGPGSGKTVVIVNRVYNLVHYKNINPRNIIVITFTKAAANNMKNRYLALSKDKNSPFFGTFHGLFYKMLKSHYDDINIISSIESFKVVKNFLTAYMEEVSEEKVKEIINTISVFKSSNITMEDFQTDLDKTLFKNSYEYYETYKKEKKLLDFEDLQILCKNLLIKNSRLLDNYKKLFRHILIDEFQDCDATQLEILKLLKGDNNIFAVGDEDQCIYSFRGSRPDFMVNFHNIFNHCSKLYLSTNYRSYTNIVDLSMKCICNNKIRSEKSIKAYRNGNGIISFSKVHSEALQGEFIAKDIEKLRESANKRYSDFAVLYRTNIESRSVIDNLIKKKIPFKLLDKEYNFYDHFICKDILAYLRLSIDPYDLESFIRVINKPYRYISKLSLDVIKRDFSPIDYFEKLKNVEAIPIFQLKAIDKLKKDIHYLNKVSLQTAIDFIIYDLGYHNYLREYCQKYKLQISDFENILEEFKESVGEYKNIIIFLAHVEEINEEIIKSRTVDKEKDTVTLSTIHGVKGMEFSDVYIINLVEGIIPHESNKEKNIEEERRLFYVGVTRAINNLTLLQPSIVQGKSKEASRFLKECNFSGSEVNSDIIAGMPIIHKNFGHGRVISIENNTIHIEFNNEVSRKFDFKVLLDNRLIEKD